MTQASSPIPLICIGRHRDLALKIEQSLAPNFVYSAIVNSYDKQTVLTLLETLNPTPSGIIVGGAFSMEVVLELEQIVGEWNEGKEGAEILKFVNVPIGTVEREGPAGLVKWIRDALGCTFGVVW